MEEVARRGEMQNGRGREGREGMAKVEKGFLVASLLLGFIR